MNKRYQNLEVTPGTYVPPVTINYPEDNPYQQLVQPVFTSDFQAGADYPYVDDSLNFKIRNLIFVPLLVHVFLRIKLRIVDGLRIKGRHILKQYKKEFANGVITVGNHCHRLDAPSILLATKAPLDIRIPMFAPNFGTKDGWYMKTVGGIPIPTKDGIAAMKAFNAAFDEFHRRGYWIHVFPETKRWDYYKPLRPFRKGAFTWAYKYNMPILPCVITYRERTGLYKLTGKTPLIQVEIGEPVFPDTTHPRAAETERLRTATHEQMCRMAGITHNTWPIVVDD